MPSDEKSGNHIPIPTYDEAVEAGSRVPSEYDDSEESPFIPPPPRPGATAPGGYRHPTVESARSSIDSDFLAELESDGEERRSLDREMLQMEVEDAEADTRRQRFGHLRERFKKRFAAWRWPRNPFRGMLEGVSMPRMPEIPCCQNAAAMMPIYRLAGIMIALVVLYALFASDALTMKSRMPADYAGQFDPAKVRSFAHNKIEYAKIAHWMEYLGRFNHMAGTQGDFVLANYVEGQFSEFKLGSRKQQYDVYLNYPTPGGRRVYMKEPEWTAKLEETVRDKDRENTPVFHGLSKTGKAQGRLIYANFGSRADFKWLETKGVKVKDTIVLMRYGGTETDPALKVRAAQEMGAVGCILFSDPKAEGWDWPADAVQRHGMGLRNWLVGDVLTPGWASTRDADRLPLDQSPGLLKIPSLPLSWSDAQHLLQSLKGIGHKTADPWTAGIPGITEYWTGSSSESPEVFLENLQAEEPTQPIWNVLGTVPGVDLRDQRVILGTHRDSWCFGASNPNSGTAVMLEVARVLGLMMDAGWRPRRTIQLASWDASSYNLIGSTEWVEEQDDSIRTSVLAYVNLDAAVTGTEFTASGSPSLHTPLKNILPNILDPVRKTPISDLWDSGKYGPLGTESDYVPFQHHAGIPSIDLSFRGKFIPQHSCYDDFALIQSKDPDMQYHAAMAQIVIRLLLELADTPIVPINMTDYSVALDSYTTEIKAAIPKTDDRKTIGLEKLDLAAQDAKSYIQKFEEMEGDWMMMSSDGIYSLEDNWSVGQRRIRSARLSGFEKGLCDIEDGGGVPGRNWYRHMISGPLAWGSKSVAFPAVRDAVDRGDWEDAKFQVEKAAGLIERAGRKLLEVNEVEVFGETPA